MEGLSTIWSRIQGFLFPYLEEVLDPLTERQKKLVSTLELIRIEEFIPSQQRGLPGCPPHDRQAIARAFVAKSVYNFSTTRFLLDQLASSPNLRRICGWEKHSEIPSESVFSRAFKTFANSDLPQRVHAALIEKYKSNHLVGHISRDATAIEAREKPEKKLKEPPKPKGKRGRPKKGEEPPPKPPTRLERQVSGMTLDEMQKDLPKACNHGSKKNSKGYKESWIGYKLHIDAADGQIPISCILTSASVHDSQVAIPLAEMTSKRVVNLYDIMDSGYDMPVIREHSIALGHIPIIDVNPRRNKELKLELAAESKRQRLLNIELPEDVRYKERSTVERVNGRLKDEFGGRTVRVRGPVKVMAHLMFGILALTADQLLRLAI